MMMYYLQNLIAISIIPSDILHDIVAHSGNHENCSSCWMNLIRDRITNSLMKQ
jgi:hypothetical protein